MAHIDLTSRIRGCVIGAAMGDAIGGPFESFVQSVAQETGLPQAGQTWSPEQKAKLPNPGEPGIIA